MHQALLVATNNPHKLAEFRDMTAVWGLEIVAPRELGLDLEVDETGASFAENAVLKAEAFARASGRIALADDSGLEVKSLDCAPGIYSARFGGSGLDDRGRTALLLQRMARVPDGQRQARFVAAIAIALPGSPTLVVQSEVDGVITRVIRGEGGFGYDPVFYYPPYGCTFAELSREHKAEVSHRGKALALALERLHAAYGPDILGGERGSPSHD